MAIRKDLDDMLNNLKGNNPEKTASAKTEPARYKSIYDSMSVDDLLNALTVEKKPSLAENILNELEDKEKKAAEAAAVNVPEVPKVEESPVPEQKKKVIIKGELPDYEELRRIESEQTKRQGRIRDEEGREEIAAGDEPEKISEPEPEVSAAAEENVPDDIPEEPEVQIAEETVQNDADEDTDKTEETEKESGSRKKKGLFSRHRKKHSDDESRVKENPGDESEKSVENADDEIMTPEEDAPSDEESETENDDDRQDAENDAGESATDLIEAALAAINGDPEAEEDTVETPDADENKNDPETEEKNDPGEKDGVTSLIDDIRENAANAIAELEEQGREDDADEETTEAESSQEQENPRHKGRFTAALTNILDEDPETLIDVKREKTEESEEDTLPKKKKFKRRLYAVMGVIFTIFAVIGIVTTAGKGVSMFRKFASGETKKDGFTELVYPMVIMDIESFDKPSDLTSEQIITASIWSIIMNDEKLEKYPVNAAGGDVISISAYDVEAEAVALFGQDHEEFVHTTVGPVTSRFYYDPEKGVYNVPIHPIVFTYEPEIKSIVKRGSQYTVTVDYIDERPAWMDKSVSKSVEFHVTEKSDGTYQFDSMNILYVKNNL